MHLLKLLCRRVSTIIEDLHGAGSFVTEMRLFIGDSPIPRNYSVSASDDVRIEVGLCRQKSNLKVVLTECWATPSSNARDPVMFSFINNRWGSGAACLGASEFPGPRGYAGLGFQGCLGLWGMGALAVLVRTDAVCAEALGGSPSGNGMGAWLLTHESRSLPSQLPHLQHAHECDRERGFQQGPV